MSVRDSRAKAAGDRSGASQRRSAVQGYHDPNRNRRRRSRKPDAPPGHPRASPDARDSYTGAVPLHVGDARLGRGGGLLLAGPFPRSGERSGACLEISADVPSGVPEDVVSTVTENAKTLNFEQHGFEEE
jgi:hypothetical protein